MSSDAHRRADEATSGREPDSPAAPSPSSQIHTWHRQRHGPLVALSQVSPERLHWLSPGRLAAGKITILDGDPGLGKSTLLCEFAARISRGDPLPGGEAAPPRPVVLMSAEDDLVRHHPAPYRCRRRRHPARYRLFRPPRLRPRAARSSSPMMSVFLKSFAPTNRPGAPRHRSPGRASSTAPTTPTAIRPCARPSHSFTGLGERTGVAIVAVRHLNKSMPAIPSIAVAAASASSAPPAAASSWRATPTIPTVASSPPPKAISAPPPTLAFRLVAPPGSHVARVVWDGESQWQGDQLLRESISGVAPRSLLAEAQEPLRAALADGPRPAREILRDAGEAGIGRDLLYAARKLEGVRIGKERVAGGRWVWSPTAERRRTSWPP